MTRLILLFSCCLLISTLKSQSGTDTFTLNVCTKFWKTKEPIKGIFPSANLPFDTSGVCSKFFFTPGSLVKDYCPAGRRNKTDYLNGVNVLDILLIRDHILAINPLPIEAMLASDVSKSGSITTLDLVLLQKILLGTELPTTFLSPSWLLASTVNDSIVGQNPLNPFMFVPIDTCNKVDYLPGQTVGNITMAAIKRGDVNGDASVTSSQMVLTTPSTQLTYPDQWVLPGDIVAVPIHLIKSWNTWGFQMEIAFDNTACTLLDTVQSGVVTVLKNTNIAFHGNTARVAIPLSVFPNNQSVQLLNGGDHLFTIYIRANKSFKVSDVISLKTDILPAFIVDENMVLYPFVLQPGNRIYGQVYADEDMSCSPTSGDIPLPKYIMRATNNRTGVTTYSTSNELGRYQMVVDSGTYTLIAAPWNYWESCTDSFQVSFISGSLDSVLINIGLQKTAECPLMNISLTAPVLRRCIDNNYYVEYSNLGTVSEPDVRIELSLPPELSYVSSTIPAASVTADKVIFIPGALAVGASNRFAVVLKAACDSLQMGSYVCVDAHIFPDIFCKPDPRWTGANVAVDARCDQDSVYFSIKNTGTFPTQTLEFVIIEDQVIMRTASFQLTSGGVKKYSIPANGSTLRLTAEQEPYHPVQSVPTVAVEGCGLNQNGTFTLGVAGQFPENDASMFTDKECLIVRGSFDPNDKQGFPEGVKDEHYIVPGTALEYRIRFQNVGNDTAFNVVVTDTLSEALDPTTLEIGSASHPFRWELTGRGVLKFVFHNIMLPDSNQNESTSHGFVKFRIRHRPNLKLGSTIHNRAAIYFDFNAPVITNETWHTVDTGFLRVSVQNKEPFADFETISASPNPVSAGQWISFLNLPKGNYQVHLMDVNGRKVSSGSMSKGWFQIGQLPSGVYFYVLESERAKTVIGKLSVK